MIEIKEISAEETWPLRHKVMWPDQSFEFVKVENDHEGKHFGLFMNTQLTSIVSLFHADQSYQFRKLATAIEQQGNGFGSKLLNHLFEYAQGEKVPRIWCNARADKIAFYKRFGMTETDKRFVKAGIDFVIMERIFHL
ncbi:MAG: GNAT family N-acetyltransferase [Cyclobacteriaceae bacterium]